jgi:hypothetical protein
MSAIIEENYRSKMNEKLLADNNKIVKQFSILTLMRMLQVHWCKNKRTIRFSSFCRFTLWRCVKYHLKPVIKLGN